MMSLGYRSRPSPFLFVSLATTDLAISNSSQLLAVSARWIHWQAREQGGFSLSMKRLLVSMYSLATCAKTVSNYEPQLKNGLMELGISSRGMQSSPYYEIDLLDRLLFTCSSIRLSLSLSFMNWLWLISSDILFWDGTSLITDLLADSFRSTLARNSQTCIFSPPSRTLSMKAFLQGSLVYPRLLKISVMLLPVRYPPFYMAKMWNISTIYSDCRKTFRISAQRATRSVILCRFGLEAVLMILFLSTASGLSLSLISSQTRLRWQQKTFQFLLSSNSSKSWSNQESTSPRSYFWMMANNSFLLYCCFQNLKILQMCYTRVSLRVFSQRLSWNRIPRDLRDRPCMLDYTSILAYYQYQRILRLRAYSEKGKTCRHITHA